MPATTRKLFTGGDGVLTAVVSLLIYKIYAESEEGMEINYFKVK